MQEKYRLLGFSEEKIKKLMDTKSDATDEMISEAKKAIELIIEGTDPGMNWSADTTYLQYISDWLLENSEDIKEDKKKKIEDYWEKHLAVATKNAEQKQFREELILNTKQSQALIENPKTAPEVTVGEPTSVAPTMQ
jgi:hypothetical protein